MDDQLESNVENAAPKVNAPAQVAGEPQAQTQTPATPAPQPAPQSTSQHAPYVRQRPAHRSVGTVSDYDDAGEAAPARTAHDSGYTNRGSLVSGGAYRRSRSDAKKLRRDLQYGQYLEIPKGRRDIFVKRERTARIKTALALVVVIAILAVVVFFMWGFMQTNWGATS